jgi:AraC-like DNA-binding protein
MLQGDPAMAASFSIPTIQAAATAGILEHTERGGGDVDWVVAQAKLTLEELSRPEQRLPLRSFVKLIEAASSATNDDCFGLHLGEICTLRELGLPGHLATFAPDVQSALSGFARYYYLLGDATDVRFEKQGGLASFTYRVLDPQSWPRRQDAEQVITMIVMLLRQWIGPSWAAERVCFEHARPAGAGEIERILRCPVRFDCDSNTVFFGLEDASHRNPNADAKLFQLLSWFAETVTESTACGDERGLVSFKEQVLFSIDTCENLGNASIHSVSRALGLEARTFQRRLRAEQTSFSDLQEEYRSRQALKLLQRPELTEKELASRLGYASLNSFIRAFRRWHGLTPGQFREQRRLS